MTTYVQMKCGQLRPRAGTRYSFARAPARARERRSIVSDDLYFESTHQQGGELGSQPERSGEIWRWTVRMTFVRVIG